MGVRGARAAHVIRPAAALLQLLPLPCMSNSDAIRVAPHAPCWCDWRAPPLVIADTAPARWVVLLLLCCWMLHVLPQIFNKTSGVKKHYDMGQLLGTGNFAEVFKSTQGG